MNGLKILAFGDLNGDSKLLSSLLQKDLSIYDLVLFSGDIPNPEIFKKLSKKLVEQGLGDLGDRSNLARETEPREALKQAQREVEEMMQLFKEIQKRTKLVGVWGNADNQKILRKVPIEKYIKIIHNKAFQVGDYYFLGYNGRPLYIFEKENKEQWAFSEGKIYNELTELFKKLENKKVILITHAPPYGILDQVVPEYREYGIGTYGERAEDGHIGSTGLKRIVDEFNPSLHVFGHIHEGRGWLKNDTVFVNTGSMGEEKEVAEIHINTDGIKVIFKKI